ncbi:MAG: hypothetical protein D6820_12980 [Lentisphaerae bacterium]|nr:MAG: hypothetical protein D6820_12980 [Lentisphaerota bacterium]
MASPAPKVVIVGARGIGRHHARWWYVEGAEPAGIVGTNAATLPETVKTLQSMFPFAGIAGTSLNDLIHRCQPDIVDICCPHPAHARYIHETINESDARIVCEKPLVFDPDKTVPQLLEEAEELRQLIHEHERDFLLTTQYPVLARHVLDDYHQHWPAESILALEATLKTPGKVENLPPQYIWIDLAPHLLAMVHQLFPEAHPCWEDMNLNVVGQDVTIMLPFTIGNRLLKVTFNTGRTHGEPKHIKALKVNESLYEFFNAKTPDGHFGIEIKTPETAFVVEDPMRVMLREYLNHNILVGIDAAITNTQWLLKTYEAIVRHVQT